MGQGQGELLSIKEATQLTGLSRAFLIELDTNNTVKAIRIGTGRHRRFRRQDLEAYMKEGNRYPQPTP